MTAALTPVPKIQFFADDGTPLVGGKLYSYAAGTTTPLATYTTYAGTVANTNPVILDSRGEANVWLGANVYKLALYDADNALIWTVDNITPEGDAALVSYLPAGTGAVITTVQAKLRESVSVKDFGAVGDGVTDDTAAIQAALNYAATVVQNIIPTKVDVVTAAVYLPSGSYRTSAALVVGEGTTFYGASQSTSIIKPTHTGNAINMGGSSREYSQIRVCNLGVIGNRSGTLSYGLWTTTTTIGIYAENCIRECAIENCFITQCSTSVKTENSYAFEINKCYMIYALLYHIHSDNAVGSTISGNRLDWSEQHGIYLNGTNAGDETLTALIQGNAIQICWRNGIWLYDCSSASIISNFFEANYREAVAATYTYADINIEDGPTVARTYAFDIQGNFFTHGSSPDLDVYTAIKCDKASSLNVIGNVCRDSFYNYFIYANSANVTKLVVLGNALAGTFTNVVFNSATTYGIIEEQLGDGTIYVPKLANGSMQYGATVTSSNATSGAFRTVFFINCAAGNRQLTLQDVDCVAGRIYTVKKTDGGAVNTLTVIPQAASTKTIDGAASVSSAAAYAVFRIVSDGTNWFVI